MAQKFCFFPTVAGGLSRPYYKNFCQGLYPYMSPAKNLGGGRGLRKFFFFLGGVKKFHEILQQIFENLKGWSKNYQKMPFFCQIFKQWLLAGEFSEFEYLPEIRHFWRVQVLAKTAVFRNMRDSPDSPTFAKPCCADSPDSPRFAKSCCADSPDLPTFAKPCCMNSPDSRKASLACVTQI